MIRGSAIRPTAAIASTGSMSRPVTVKGASVFQSRFSMGCLSFNVNTVNINIVLDVDTVNSFWLRFLGMARPTHPKSENKSAKPYHHGDLRRALLDEALRTIEADGVEHLTLRTVGARLGVSR